MKKIFFTLAVLLAAVCAEAQVQEKMVVERYDGTTEEYNVADVKRVTFVKEEWLDYSDFWIETTHLQVPWTGGSFTVRFSSKNPVSLELPDDVGLPNVVTLETFFDSFYASDGVSHEIALEKEISDNVVTINVGKAEFGQTKTVEIPLYGKQGQDLSRIVVEQAGDPEYVAPRVLLGNDGKAIVASMFSSLSGAYMKLWQTEIEIKSSYFPDFTPLSPNTSFVNEIWNRFYSGISVLNRIKEIDGANLGAFQNALTAHAALAYLGLTNYWGDVPYAVSTENYMLPRTEKSQILDDFIAKLSASLDSFDDTQIAWGNDEVVLTRSNTDDLDLPNRCFFLTKDIVRLILAKLHMERRNYAQAKALIEAVVSSGRYCLTEGSKISYGFGTSECIYAFHLGNRGSRAKGITEITISDPMAVLDYKDVLLDLAECLHYTGEDEAAAQLLTQFCQVKDIESDETDVFRRIADIRNMIYSPFYLPFIRRNNLGESWLGMNPSETYQLLFPIPNIEVLCNPCMTQNPGYGGTR